MNKSPTAGILDPLGRDIPIHLFFLMPTLLENSLSLSEKQLQRVLCHVFPTCFLLCDFFSKTF